jgi:hypothetical protein
MERLHPSKISSSGDARGEKTSRSGCDQICHCIDAISEHFIHFLGFTTYSS